MLLIAGVCQYAAARDGATGPAGKPIELSALGKAAIGIRLQTVELKSEPTEIAVPGKIEVIPTRQFDQHAPLSGRISSVVVTPGQLVKQGQTLAIIESPEMNQLAAQLLQSRLDIESEIATQTSTLNDEVRQSEEKYQLAQNTLNRTKKLYEQRIAAEKDVVQAQTDFQIANSHLRSATANKNILLQTLRSRLALTMAPLRQRLEMLGVNESEIEDMLNQQKTMTQVPIKAARSGFVTAITASPGKNIDPSVSLFTIADLTKVWATAQVYEDDMAQMKVGEAVHVKIHALQGETVSGCLCFIGTQVDPTTRTLPVRAELDNANYRLKPDMYAELFIETAGSNSVVVVPPDAVIQQNGKNIVFVEEGPQAFQPLYVTTGRTVENLLEVTAGLQPGQKLVTQGAFQLAAELVKNNGGEALFAQATEGERIEHEDEKKAPGGLTLNIQTVVMIVAAAFIFGVAVSAIFVFRGKNGRHHGESFTIPDSTHVVTSGEPPAESTAKAPGSKTDHV
jgi:cobalt-zinc-cadmium efflux system membrane fusion protein